MSTLNDNFLTAYKRLTDSFVPLVGEVNGYVQSTNGKQLRPQLTMLSACCCGLPSDIDADHPLFAITAAIEILHSSTLIHDDVVDNSDTRRGKPSVRSLYGNKVAVLMGDYYLAKVMQTLNKVDNKEITAIVSEAVIKMSEGELLQQQHNGIYMEESDIYMTIIEHKTASFMSACCQIGSTLATDDAMLRNQARLYGLNIGIAFQIRDDILDYMPESVTGKPQGNDLREGKCTLPLIYALKNSNNKEKILALLKEKPLSDTNLHTVIDTVSQGGHLNQAANTLTLYIDRARKALEAFPHNSYRDSLYDITDKLKPIIR